MVKPLLPGSTASRCRHCLPGSFAHHCHPSRRDDTLGRSAKANLPLLDDRRKCIVYCRGEQPLVGSSLLTARGLHGSQETQETASTAWTNQDTACYHCSCGVAPRSAFRVRDHR